MWTLIGPWQNRGFSGEILTYLRSFANDFLLPFSFGRLLFIRYGYFGRVTPEVVRLMLCNVSGCLTDGRIFLSSSAQETVSINVKDTTGIRMLQREKVEVGIWDVVQLLTGLAHVIAPRTPHCVLLHQVVLLISKEDPVARSLGKKLAKRMGCKVLRVGEEPLNDLRPLVKRMKLKWKDVAYMGKSRRMRALAPALLLLSYSLICISLSSRFAGNDKPDVDCLSLAGLSAVPADAPVVALNAAKYACHQVGGMGAVREFAEHILLQKQKAKAQMQQDRIDTCSS